jgi:hypothetical protein
LEATQLLPAPRNLERRITKGHLKHLPSDFRAAVRLLKRPYFRLSAEQFARIEAIAGDSDTVLLDGTKLMTYGRADGGYALMPINTSQRSSGV